MSEAEKGQNVRVNDRRRFEPDGSPREAEAGDPATEQPDDQAQGPAGAGTQQAASGGAAAEDLSGEAEAPPDGGSAAAEVERLTQELDAARRRIDELARAYQSLNQDRDEFKQRLNRERERMLEVEKGKVAVALLEAIDELDRCLSASPDDESPLASGVRLIRENLLGKAQSTGIERLDVVGRPFDPNLAEAVDMEITTDPEQDQAVLEEFIAGYRLKDRVIRPARVRVAKYVKPADA